GARLLVPCIAHFVARGSEPRQQAGAPEGPRSVFGARVTRADAGGNPQDSEIHAGYSSRKAPQGFMLKRSRRRRMAGRLTLTVLGSGDAFGSGGRNQSGYLVQARGFCMLMDCGVTTLVSLKRHRVDPTSLDLVLLTHLHGDHVAGLPFLFHDFKHAGFRKSPLRVAGPRGPKG